MFGYYPHPIRDGTKHKSATIFCCIEFQDGGYVATAIAVVGGRPNSDKFFIKHVLDAFLDELMCTTYQLQIIQMHKLLQQDISEIEYIMHNGYNTITNYYGNTQCKVNI